MSAFKSRWTTWEHPFVGSVGAPAAGSERNQVHASLASQRGREKNRALAGARARDARANTLEHPQNWHGLGANPLGDSTAKTAKTQTESAHPPEGGAAKTAKSHTMPPDIRAAYDSGAAVVYIEGRGWEVYTPPVPRDLSPAVLALLDAWHAQRLEPRVQARLDALMQDPPADIHQRLEAAARFVRRQA